MIQTPIIDGLLAEPDNKGLYWRRALRREVQELRDQRDELQREMLNTLTRRAVSGVSPVERAIEACLEAATALDAVPCRRTNMLGSVIVATGSLRDEAAWIRRTAGAWVAAAR